MGANIARGAENFDIPAQAPEPRLFVIHGRGGAEELLTAERAKAILGAAKTDPLVKVVGDQPLQESSDFSDSRTCHTIFKKRLPDMPVAAPPALVALPDGLDVAGSVYSMATSSSMLQNSIQDSGTAITEFTQLIQYPEISEETRTKFKGTLKQYRQWEVEQSQRLQDMLRPEVKGKKEVKKDKKKDEKD